MSSAPHATRAHWSLGGTPSVPRPDPEGDGAVDDDPELRTLAAELAHDDPALAAFLTGGKPPHRHHPVVWLTVALAGAALLLLLPPTVMVGVLAMLLVVASPLAVCWLCSVADDVPRPRNP